jgi:hypothetical protein
MSIEIKVTFHLLQGEYYRRYALEILVSLSTATTSIAVFFKLTRTVVSFTQSVATKWCFFTVKRRRCEAHHSHPSKVIERKIEKSIIKGCCQLLRSYYFGGLMNEISIWNTEVVIPME